MTGTLSDQDKQILTLHEQKLPVPEIARRVGRRTSYVNKVLGQHGLKKPPRPKRPKSP